MVIAPSLVTNPRGAGTAALGTVRCRFQPTIAIAEADQDIPDTAGTEMVMSPTIACTPPKIVHVRNDRAPPAFLRNKESVHGRRT